MEVHTHIVALRIAREALPEASRHSGKVNVLRESCTRRIETVPYHPPRKPLPARVESLLCGWTESPDPHQNLPHRFARPAVIHQPQAGARAGSGNAG